MFNRAGFMRKQGHLVKTWQRRYFVLDMGILKYYEKCSNEAYQGAIAQQQSASNGNNKKRRFSVKAPGAAIIYKGDNLKGQLGLAGSVVKANGPDRLYITEGKDGSKDMLLHIEDGNERDSLGGGAGVGAQDICKLWLQDLQKHIEFATENQHLVNFQSKN
jgi:hypothetical protein